MFSKDLYSRHVKTRACLGRVKENIVGKGEITQNEQFHLFIRPSKTGRIMGSPVAGGRRPVLCPEHISKTTLPRVMKFHG